MKITKRKFLCSALPFLALPAFAGVRRIGTYALAPRQSIAAIGDSLTCSYEGFGEYNNYPAVLAGQLSTMGIPFRARNFGVSGETSTQMLARVACMTNYDVPSVAVVWAGFNDPANSIASATTTSNIQAITNAIITAGCSRVIVCSRHYLNYSAGDNGVTAPAAGTALDLWTAAQTAATNLIAANPGKVAFCDLFGWFNTLLVANPSWINDGTKWNVAAGNVHLNAYGQSQVAAAILATIKDRSGWLTAMRSSI